MIRALYTAASGMSAQQANLDTVSNNLSNSGTAGFKGRRLQFEDMIYQNMITPGAAQSQQTVSAGLQIGLGTKSLSSEVIMTQGEFNQTGNQYDLAISGSGFFQVQMPNGTIGYTRNGNFSLNNAGQVVDANGDQLLPALTIPSNATSVTISQYGVVTAMLPGQTAATQLGQIQLATFPNPGGLMSMGGNLLQPTSASGNAITDNPGGATGIGTLQQGYLENSNVDVVAEFVNMILAQRAYESNSKVIHVADDTPATVVYAGDSGTESVETPTGQKIQVSVAGNAVFGGGGATGVLTVLNQLIADFSSGTVSSSTLSDTNALSAALSQVSSQRGILDSGLNRLQQTSAYAQTDETQLTAQQGTLMSADIADVATKLQAAELQHQALLSVMTALNGTNLFSYMK